MININGKIYQGNNISINNGVITIDGNTVTPNDKVINITVEGNIDNLEVDHANTINITGDCNKVRSGSGDIKCKNINNGAQTGSGDIASEGGITGDIQSGSGDINVWGNVSGSVRTGSGSINHK